MTQPFRLAGLLRFRKLEEDQASAQLARANNARRTHAAGIAATRRELDATAVEAYTAVALNAAAAARASARSMLLELEGVDAALAGTVATAQAELVRAKTAAGTLEKLAERHKEAAGVAELAAEQHFLDELSAARRKARP